MVADVPSHPAAQVAATNGITGTRTKAETKRESSPGKRTAPGGESGGPDVRLAGDPLSLATFCARCGAVLTARSSVARGIGPVCVRLGQVVV